MNYRSFYKAIILIFTVTGLLSGCSPEDKERSKPSFIIIQMDDLGYSDLGIHGNMLIETPVIDSLAMRSVQFSNFYVNPVCAPTRASLLTGRNFLKTGVSHVHGGKDHLHLDEKTMADLLAREGYICGMWGKWHSGTADGYLPWQRGFDEAYAARLYKHENSEGLFNGIQVETGKWADDAICDYALDFIERNKNKPFLAYLSFLTCHSPLKAEKELIQIYENKGLSRNLSTLYAMIHHADHSLGIFLSKLDSLGILENTVIMFMSDNGPAIENGKLTDSDRGIRYVNNLRGHKGNIWENGVKSPFFFFWKGKYKNRVEQSLTDITDIVPTMLDLAGVDPAEFYPGLDGTSLLEILENKPTERQKISFNYANPGWPPTDQPWTPEGIKDEYRPLTQEMKQNLSVSKQIISVRKGKYKLLQNAANYPGSPSPEDNFVLVNINEDPREEINLVEEEPEIYISMKTMLDQWFAEIKSSPHSFAMPVFKIKPDRDNLIFAKAPEEITEELKNAFNFLAGWDESSKAKYKISTSQEIRMKLNLEFHGPIPQATSFLISAGADEIRLDTSKPEQEKELIVPKGLNLITIECIRTENPGFSLQNIILRPVARDL